MEKIAGRYSGDRAERSSRMSLSCCRRVGAGQEETLSLRTIMRKANCGGRWGYLEGNNTIGVKRLGVVNSGSDLWERGRTERPRLGKFWRAGRGTNWLNSLGLGRRP